MPPPNFQANRPVDGRFALPRQARPPLVAFLLWPQQADYGRRHRDEARFRYAYIEHPI